MPLHPRFGPHRLMDLYEHQGKQLFAGYGVPVPSSELVRTVDEGRRAAVRIGWPLAVKAQVLTGGRGKAGGVKIVRDGDELEQAVEAILGMTIGGRSVDGVLLEQGVAVAREFYLAVTLDRGVGRPLVLFSSRGGVDIERVAYDEPEAVFCLHIDPLVGMQEFQLRDLGFWAGFSADERGAIAGIVRAVWRLYHEKDATLVEINPLSQEGSGRFVALDAKVTIDDNAIFRHPELERLTGFSPVQGLNEARELRAREVGVAYVGLDGDIGILGNGAGMVMSALDQVAAAGGRPANFLDLGGGAREPQIHAALDVVLSDAHVRVILVTVFGGITRCDEVAHGLLASLESHGARVPVVACLSGTNHEEGTALLRAAARPDLYPIATLTDAVEKAVELAGRMGPVRRPDWDPAAERSP